MSEAIPPNRLYASYRVRVARVPAVVQDASLAAALFLLTLGPARLEGASGPVLQAALVLPLVWRRRAPRAVFGVIAAVALVQWLLGVQSPADAALLIALGTVTARSSRRSGWAAVVVATAGAVLAAARWAPEGRFLASAAAMTAAVAASALLGANTRMRRAAEEERVAALERRARLAVAEERTRIAREFHDSVTHSLSVMVALADAVVHARPDDALTVTTRIAETGRQALTDMRRSLGLLQEDEADAERHPPPGLAELGPLCERMEAAGLRTRLRLNGDIDRVPTAAQLTVHRLVQESLTNALRHTPEGTRAEVRVSCTPQTVMVEVSDNGPAGPPGPAPAPGRGLAGMRQRAAAYGGVLDAGPLPDGGWQVSVRLVLDPDGAP
ncbi:histidine kinase [Streptomyces sp. NPDC094032]|uniref:sensor histidine kinase n=1 Tax=Streptomyces sp. NPDC094032 TaxID=3155308 RepID=UPI00332BAE27